MPTNYIDKIITTDNTEYVISVDLNNVQNADDLKAIEGVSGSSGLLKKTASNTWTLDTSNYATTSQVPTKTSDLTNDSGYLTSSDVDLSNYMVKGVDYVTAGQLAGSTLGSKATAEGVDTTASGARAHAHGYETVASGQNSFAGGARTQATGTNSFAFGSYTTSLPGATASGAASIALGTGSTSSANYSIATGYNTTASGDISYAGGHTSQSSGYGSSAIGVGTIANHQAQFVFGKSNIADPSTAASTAKGTYIEIVGNGTGLDIENRSNARTLDWDGNEVLAGKITVGAVGTNSMDVATVGQIPVVPTNVSAFTNDAGYITSADVPEGASAYTGTISAVSTAASSGTSNGFARGDHTHNITKTTIDSTLGTGSGTTKFYREDGSWATPDYIANTDEKLKIAAVTSGTTYYPVVAANSTAAAARQYDATGLAYAGTNGTTSAVGTAKITLGNSTASGTANNKKGQIILYGSTAYATTIDPGSPTAARTITLPDKAGTVALTSDIPTKVSELTNDSGFITSDNKVKQSPIGNSTLRKGVLLSYDSYSGLSNETTNTSYVSNRFLFCPGNSSDTVPSLEVLDSSGNKSGRLSYNNVILQNSSNSYQTTVTAGTPTANNTVTLPSATGTVALTSDIPNISGKVNITETNDGTTTEIVRDVDLNALRLKASSSYGEGFVEVSTVGAYISSNLGAAVSVNSNVIQLISDADDLSKPNLSVNSSSVSITSPSITLLGLSTGSAYTLAGSATAGRTLTLPDKTGTVALTSDIPTISYPVTSVNTKTGAVSLTASDVGAAASSHAHGNITSGGDITATAPTIANGDQIVINDSSASKITNGPTFDGSTTTKALTPKGTWETFSKFSGSYNDLSNKPTIPTVPTNISAFTNDAGYITSADVPEGASAYTGTISAVGTAASSGTNNGFARGDHVHNITKTTIDSVLGTGSGTTKYYREDGTWVTPTDTKNTAGSTNTSSKIFLIGATSQAANPQTYSHDTAYVGTDGKLYSASKVVLVGGSNASSSVTITPTTTDVYSMTSAGSVTAGTKASFTRGTFSQGTLPTMTWAMDSTDTKKLNITFSQGTLPTHAADSFTANTPTAVTLPGRSSAIKAWTGYSSATAAAQAFTGVTA